MYYLAEYSTFNTTEQLNEALLAHTNRHYYEMNETDRAVLKQVGRYAVKYRGVAQLKADTLAELLNVSTKTVRRSLTKLCTLNIVEKRTTLRPKSGGYGANIIVILPVVQNEQPSLFDLAVQSEVSTRQEADKPTETTVQTEESNSESITLSKRKNKNNVLDTEIQTRNEKSGDKISNEPEVPASVLKDVIPAPIYDVVTKYFSSVADLYKYYGVMLRAKASVSRDIRFEEEPFNFTEAFERCIFAWKSGKLRKSFEALLYAAIQGATLQTVRQAGRERYETGYLSWLTVK